MEGRGGRDARSKDFDRELPEHFHIGHLASHVEARLQNINVTSDKIVTLMMIVTAINAGATV